MTFWVWLEGFKSYVTNDDDSRYNGALQTAILAKFGGACFKAGAYTRARRDNSSPRARTNYGEVVIQEPKVAHIGDARATADGLSKLPLIGLADFQNAQLPGAIVDDRRIELGGVGSELEAAGTRASSASLDSAGLDAGCRQDRGRHRGRSATVAAANDNNFGLGGYDRSSRIWTIPLPSGIRTEVPR